MLRPAPADEAVEAPITTADPTPPEILFNRPPVADTETIAEPAAEITEPVKVAAPKTPKPVIIEAELPKPEAQAEPVAEMPAAAEVVEKSEVVEPAPRGDIVPTKAEKTEVVFSEDISDAPPQLEAAPEKAEEADFDLHQIIEDYRTAMEFTWGNKFEDDETSVEPPDVLPPEAALYEIPSESEDTEKSFNQAVEYIIKTEQVSETYKELAQLWQQEKAAEPEPPFVFFEDREGEIELRPLPSPEDRPVNAFAEFIAEQPAEDKDEVAQALPVTLESIQQKAEDEQPVETVLAELSSLLEKPESAEPETQPQLNEIKQLLNEIHQEIRVNIEQAKPPITPELTRKLLALMEVVGYQDPQKALLDMANRHGIDFVLQAMEYLYQLTLEENRYEFASQTAPSTSDEDSASTRLGKAILKLIHGQPEMQAA